MDDNSGSMGAFHLRLPEIGWHEYRSLHIRGDRSLGLPDGDYGFCEHYCEGIDCDCRRVILTVHSPQFPGQILATINYGWETREFYEEWGGPGGSEFTGPILEPFGRQSQYADVLLECFKRFLPGDIAYVERLKRHYALFKKALRANGAGGRAQTGKARPKSPKRRKRRRKRR